jgi:hypothetical protein
MKINGIWTGEIYTPYGWENSGVYILDGGDIVGGSNRHYSAGNYKQSGKKFKANLNVNYYGPPRVIFGDRQEKLEIKVTGKIKKNVINGEIVRPDKPQYTVRYRLTKRMDLVKNNK